MQTDIFKKPYDTLKVGVPALIYVIQNNLLFLALAKLDAATYQVTYQLKILTTAFCSVVMMGTKLNAYKWTALILLTTGVALVQLPKSSSTNEIKVSTENRLADRYIGLFAVIASCCLSGFAGIYFEKILKTSHVSLWMRNFQLGIFYLLYSYIG